MLCSLLVCVIYMRNLRMCVLALSLCVCVCDECSASVLCSVCVLCVCAVRLLYTKTGRGGARECVLSMCVLSAVRACGACMWCMHALKVVCVMSACCARVLCVCACCACCVRVCVLTHLLALGSDLAHAQLAAWQVQLGTHEDDGADHGLVVVPLRHPANLWRRASEK